MIKNREALSIAESQEYIRNYKNSEAEIKEFVNKFVSLSSEEAKKMRENLNSLNLIKLKREDISKIIDLLPETQIELNKIFVEVNLNEDETKKILNTIKEFK